MTLFPWEVLELLPLREKIIGDLDLDLYGVLVWSLSVPGSLLREETDGWRWIEELE